MILFQISYIFHSLLGRQQYCTEWTWATVGSIIGRTKFCSNFCSALFFSPWPIEGAMPTDSCSHLHGQSCWTLAFVFLVLKHQYKTKVNCQCRKTLTGSNTLSSGDAAGDQWFFRLPSCLRHDTQAVKIFSKFVCVWVCVWSCLNAQVLMI